MEEVKKSLKILTVLVGLSLFISLLGLASTLMLSNSFNKALNGGSGSAPSPTGNAVAGAPSANVQIGDSPVLGKANAPVTIIEFSDFQCPYCERFFSQTYPQIKTNYIDTGKAKIVFKNFPLPFHENAQKAAEASEAAKAQGKFWEMHDKMFSNQNAITVNDLKAYAASLGLDTNKFNSDLDSGKYASAVSKDLADGAAAGVSGTPSFFVNGQQLVGAQPYSAFQQAIDAALAK